MQGVSALQRRVTNSIIQYSDDISRIVAALGSPWAEEPGLEYAPSPGQRVLCDGESGGVSGESASSYSVPIFLVH